MLQLGPFEINGKKIDGKKLERLNELLKKSDEQVRKTIEGLRKARSFTHEEWLNIIFRPYDPIRGKWPQKKQSCNKIVKNKPKKKTKTKPTVMRVKKSKIQKLLEEKKFKKVAEILKKESARIDKVLKNEKQTALKQDSISLNNRIFKIF